MLVVSNTFIKNVYYKTHINFFSVLRLCLRYLTSRATSPMEPAESDVFIAADKTSLAGKGKVRNRLLARTKTKKYPVGDRKRRRQLKDISVQVIFSSCEVVFVFVFIFRL